MSGTKKNPTEIMNSTYKLKAPKLPERLNRRDTDNILFYMTQHLPMKVCTENHVLAMYFFSAFLFLCMQYVVSMHCSETYPVKILCLLIMWSEKYAHVIVPCFYQYYSAVSF